MLEATVHRLATLSPLMLGWLLNGCGGASTPGPSSSADAPPQQQRPADLSRIEATAEIGALPQQETTQAFEHAFGEIQQCFHQGTQRIEFLGGEFAVKILVNAQGQAEHVFAERSTLGDTDTERCMFSALRQAPWPRPEGGLVGIAQNSFGFEMASNVRPPVEWSRTDVQDVLDENYDSIAQCKQGAHGVLATIYVDTEGQAMSVGVSGNDEHVEDARDCLVEVLSSATYPSPGSWPAKVSVQL